MSALVWILLLMVVGLALLLLEVFVPSGGVLGLLAVVALGAGVVTAFVEQGATVGMGVLAGTLLAVPAVLMLAFRWFPSTPLGRRVLPPPPSADDVLPDRSLRQRLRGLVGRRGRAGARGGGRDRRRRDRAAAGRHGCRPGRRRRLVGHGLADGGVGPRRRRRVGSGPAPL